MPTIRIPESLPKVFVLSTPLHLLAKLHWEVKEFQRSLKSKSMFRALLPAYHAFNCAVTAWHMTDWTWEYLGLEGRAQLARTFQLARIDLLSFQDAIAGSYRSLNACREIANGSKHRNVTRKKADPLVRARTEWAELKSARRGLPSYGTAWVIEDKEGSHSALEVFMNAEKSWHHILAPWMPDTFFEDHRMSGRRRSRR